jgi:hypothetical protein
MSSAKIKTTFGWSKEVSLGSGAHPPTKIGKRRMKIGVDHKWVEKYRGGDGRAMVGM